MPLKKSSGTGPLIGQLENMLSNIIKFYFEQQLVITQAQILHGLIKHKKLKRATK